MHFKEWPLLDLPPSHTEEDGPAHQTNSTHAVHTCTNTHTHTTVYCATKTLLNNAHFQPATATHVDVHYYTAEGIDYYQCSQLIMAKVLLIIGMYNNTYVC